MIASNKFNVFLCLSVFTFTASFEEKPFLSDFDNGIQAVTSICHGNTSDDPDVCLFKPVQKISHKFYQNQYVFSHSSQKHFKYITKSARAPPRV